MVVPLPLFCFDFNLNFHCPHVARNLFGRTDFSSQQRCMVCHSQSIWEGDLRTTGATVGCIFNWLFPIVLLQGKVFSTWAHSKMVIFFFFFLAHWHFFKGSPMEFICLFVKVVGRHLCSSLQRGDSNGKCARGCRHGSFSAGASLYTLRVPAHVLMCCSCILTGNISSAF